MGGVIGQYAAGDIKTFEIAPAHGGGDLRSVLAFACDISVLKESGLITGERRAQTIVYHLNTTVVQEMMRALAGLLD